MLDKPIAASSRVRSFNALSNHLGAQIVPSHRRTLGLAAGQKARIGHLKD